MAFQKASLTLYGLRRVAEAHENERMVFTSIGLGDIALTGNLSEATELAGEKQRFLITTSKVSGTNFWAACKPANIEDPNGIYVRAMGLYIADPDHESDRAYDRLYSVASIIPGYDAGPDYLAYMPQNPENAVFDYKFALHTIVSNAAYVKIVNGIGNIGVASDNELGLVSSCDDPGYCSVDPVTGVIKANDLVEVRADIEAMKEAISGLADGPGGGAVVEAELPVATESAMGGITSSSAPLKVSVDPATGEAEVNGPPNLYGPRIPVSEYMRGFSRPLSRAALDPVFEDGPAHGVGANYYPGIRGGILLPNGDILLVPGSFCPKLLIYHPQTKTIEEGPAHGLGSDPYNNFMLLPNGDVLLSPTTGSSALALYHPDTKSLEGLPTPGHAAGTLSWGGPMTRGGLLPNGDVLLSPTTGSSALALYHPDTKSLEGLPTPGHAAGTLSWGGPLPNGDVVLYRQGLRLALYHPDTRMVEDLPTPVLHNSVEGLYGTIVLHNGKTLLFGANAGHYGTYIIYEHSLETGEVTFITDVERGRGVTPLLDGRLLVAGYRIVILDPLTMTAQTPANGHASQANPGHCPTIIPDGRVIYYAGNDIIIFDPSTMTESVIRESPVGEFQGNGLFSKPMLIPGGDVVCIPYEYPRVCTIHLSGLEVGMGYCLRNGHSWSHN